MQDPKALATTKHVADALCKSGDGLRSVNEGTSSIKAFVISFQVSLFQHRLSVLIALEIKLQGCLTWLVLNSKSGWSFRPRKLAFTPAPMPGMAY